MSKINIFIIIALYIASISTSETPQPGLRIGIRDTGIQFLINEFLPKALDQLKTYKIPDLKFTTTPMFLGTLQFNFTSFQFELINFNSEDISVNFDTGKIIAEIKFLNLIANFDYHILTNFFDSQDRKSKANLSFDSLKLDLELYALKNLKSKSNTVVYGPGIKILNITLGDQLNLKLDMGDKFINKFVDFIKNNLLPFFKTNIQKAIQTKVIPEGNKKLETFLSNVDLIRKIPGTEIEVDFALIGNPLVQEGLLQISFNSSFFYNNINLDVSDNSVEIPQSTQSMKQVQAYLNQDTINSGLAAFEMGGYLNKLIDGDNINKLLNQSILNTNILEPFSNITQVYGNNKTINVDCKIQKSHLNLLEKDIGGNLIVWTSFIIKENGKVAFNALLDLNTSLGLFVENGKPHIKINSFVINNITTSDSTVGKIKNDSMKKFVNVLMLLGLPSANQYLRKMNIPVPEFEGISLSEANVTPKNGYLEIDMNFVKSVQEN